MKLPTVSFLSVITTTIAFNLNTVSAELTLPVTLSLAVFYASLCSAYVLPQSLSASYARVEVKRHSNHGGDSAIENQNDEDDGGRNRAQNNKEGNDVGSNSDNERGAGGNRDNTNGGTRSNGTANANTRAGNENCSNDKAGSGRDDTVTDDQTAARNNRNTTAPEQDHPKGNAADESLADKSEDFSGGGDGNNKVDEANINGNRTAPGTLPPGFPPSLSTGDSEGAGNGTSPGTSTGIDTGSGTRSGSETSTGTGTDTVTGTLPKGFPPPVPTIDGFVAGDELGNHPRSKFEQAAKVRRELPITRRLLRVRASISEGS